MRFMEVLTKLVVGMGRFGDHLLKKKFSGGVVAALAFVCGAGLVYALKPAPRAKPAAAPIASTPTCAETAPPAPYVAAPTYDIGEEEWDTPELQKWKNLHSGTTLPLDYDAETLSWGLSEEKVVVLPSGRTLASAGGTVYMLDDAKRVVWKRNVSWKVFDFAYVGATGLVYVTAGDNNLMILDAATGRVLRNESRNGRAGFGVAMPYGEDMCLVTDDLSGYRADYRGIETTLAPMQDNVTAWRGTRRLWSVEVPPDAELQVVGQKIYAVTRTKDRILVKEIKVPKDKR
jgi:PQQ-like domain